MRAALRGACAVGAIALLGWAGAPAAAANTISKAERAALESIGKKKPAASTAKTATGIRPASATTTNVKAKPVGGLTSAEAQAMARIATAAGRETEPAPPRAATRPQPPQAGPDQPAQPRNGREALARQNAAQAQLLVTHARRIEQLVQRVGMDPSRILNHPINRAGAQGGPFIPLPRNNTASARPGHSPLVGGLLSRPDRLRHLVFHLPLSAPVHSYTLSSGFGARRDPFTGSWAFHSGLDMPAAVDTPVYVTGPGTVIFADWHDTYGRVVEIEHEYGIRTRYAHLNRIAVKPGQRLRTGQHIGGIGSTGRSTGPHLHYEVLLDGRAVDPLPFVDIGREFRS